MLALGLMWVSTAAASVSDLSIGSSEKDVYAAVGEPVGRMNGDGYAILFYDGGGIELRDGKVVRIDPKIGSRPAKRRNSASPSKDDGWYAKAQAWMVDTYTRLTGGTSPGNTVAAPATPTPTPLPTRPVVKKTSNGGKSVDLNNLLIPGQVTVVDFYADWCGPCKRMAPKLELVAQQDSAVYLRKVDIVRWNTDVARQFKIQSIPHIRVYNGEGQMVGTPTSDLNQVIKYIAMAK